LLGVRDDDRYPIAFPISHIGGISMLVSSLVTGVRLVWFDQWDPVATPERVAAHDPTILGSAVPFFLAYLNAQERHGDEPLYSHLRIGTGGGAPLPADLNRAMRETFGVRGICNSWGLTEFPIVGFTTPEDDFEVLDTTVGFPTHGVEVRVVGDDERVLDPDEEGELRLKGPQCFAGYVDPALDAAAFDADGWFRTGDLGMLDADGRVRVTGRLKEIVIRNAENISALEVEELLFRSPDIADAAVIGVPDPRTGERVCAVIVPVAGATVGLGEVVAHFKRLNVAPYKIPERVEVVDAIPRNAMGKALKNDLRARFT
jgi:acyl-CoA synthetase (AMP-forming)/AMP-acid ligase II